MLEAAANMISGYILAVIAQYLIFVVILGNEISMFDNLAIGVVFSVISLIRSYVIRRLFERRL